MYKSSLGSGYVVASSTKVALGRFWSTLISTSPAVRKNRSKSRRKKKRREEEEEEEDGDLEKEEVQSSQEILQPHSSGDATFPGYWLGILRKPSRVEAPQTLSKTFSQIAFDSRAAGSLFVFLFLSLLLRMCLFHFLRSQINFYLSNWTGVLVFQSLVPRYSISYDHFFCRPESFLVCYPAKTQYAGSTYIMHRNVGNRLGQWPQSYAVAFVPFEHHCALPLGWLSFCT